MLMLIPTHTKNRTMFGYINKNVKVRLAHEYTMSKKGNNNKSYKIS